MQNLQWTKALLLSLTLSTVWACSEAPGPEAAPEAIEAPATPETEAATEVEADAVDVAALAEEVGIGPGGLEPEAGVGAEAVVALSVGDVQIRRTGEELFATLDSDTPELHAGDQLQTGAYGNALLLLSDGTEVEVAEDTTVAIGERAAGTAPANSIAVLIGVARFTVSPRAEGEGSFIVYTAEGIVVATGTIFAVGASVSGTIRIGVEEGAVDVAGGAQLDKSATLAAGKAIDIDVSGKLSSELKLEADAWGSWRDEAESKLDVEAAAEIQLAGSARAEAQVEATFKALETLSVEAEKAEVEANALEKANDTAGYAASADARATTLEAGLLTSLRLQQQTFAMLAHAHVAHALHRRHPKKLGKTLGKARSRLAKAVLYHKRFHVTAHQRLRPLRTGYHKHHAHGRRQAKALGHEVSAFCLKTSLRPPSDQKTRDKVKLALMRPAKAKKHDKKRKLRRRGPEPNWHAARIAKLRAARKADRDEAAAESDEAEKKPAGQAHARGHGRRLARFYKRPASPRARLLVGVAPKLPPHRVFAPSKAKRAGLVKLRRSRVIARKMARAAERKKGVFAGPAEHDIKSGKTLPPGLAKQPTEPAEPGRKKAVVGFGAEKDRAKKDHGPRRAEPKEGKRGKGDFKAAAKGRPEAARAEKAANPKGKGKAKGLRKGKGTATGKDKGKGGKP